MPDFTRRQLELRESFKTQEADFKVGERVEIPYRLAPLYKAREAALTELLALLTEPGLEPKTRDFGDKLQLLVDRWILPFTKITDGMPYPGEDVDWWRERHVTLEMQFMQGLANMEIAEARDELAKLEVALEQLIADLEKKWRTMNEEAKRIEALEAEACRSMTDIVRRAMHEGTEAWTRYGEALRRVLEKFQAVPDLVNEAVVALAKQAGFPSELAEALPKLSLAGKDYFAIGKELGIPAAQLSAANPEAMRDPGMAVSEMVQKALGPEVEALVVAVNLLWKCFIPIAAGEYASRLGEFQRSMPNEGAILVSFSQTRRDIDEFLRYNGLDRARAVFERAEAALDRWADGQPTDGLKADANQWADPVHEAFKRRYERMANTFGMFVQANQGKFIGTVNSSVENELIFTDVWADRTQGLMDIGMDERLREWRKGTIELTDKIKTASRALYDHLLILPFDARDKVIRALDAYWDTVLQRL
jgi:hypothetical protein